MRYYSEEDLKKAIDYACGYQKANSYTIINNLLTVEGYDQTEHDKAVLEELSNCDSNAAHEITLEDINDYLD